MFTVATANVNGIRAAVRRGMPAWLDRRAPDVLCLQEVRAPDAVLREVFAEGWHLVHEEAEAKGRAGVAVLSRGAPAAVRVGLGDVAGAERFARTGRWVEMDLPTPAGPLTVVSAYVHSGEVDTPKQDDKYAFLDAMTLRLRQLGADGARVLVCGDLNVAHREVDIKNWKGNVKRAGFLPQERAYFDTFFGEMGWVDVHRALAGPGPGPYTWWSWRGKAFDTDAGWRIDYHMATPALATTARTAEVDRADTYDERFSDHAPLVVTYDLG